MKLEKFTLDTIARFGKVIRMSMLPALLLVLTTGENFAQTQCPLACNNLVQVSMDVDCEVTITPDMMLEGNGVPPSCDYRVEVLGANGQPLVPADVVNRSHVNKTFNVRVWLGNNHCWGKILVEDKLPPVIDCPDDVTVFCFETYNPSLPEASDNCTLNVPVSLISDVTVDLGCNSQGGLSAIRTLTYGAQDLSGNQAVNCTYTVAYERVGISSEEFEFPANRDDVELAALECDNSPLWDVVKANGQPGADGYPQPVESGMPTIGGVPLFPNNTYCELNATYSDQVINICPGSFKVLRHWTVLDWCSGGLQQDFQIIKVVDKNPPVVTIVPNLPPNTTISNCTGNVSSLVYADPYTCEGTWDVVRPTVIEVCSGWTYSVAFIVNDGTEVPPVGGVYVTDNGTTRVIGNATAGYQIVGLPQGCAWVRYTVTDGCGNTTQAFTEIFVKDEVPPTPVCDQFTVVTLSNNGTALVFAETFDDGSHDNCSDVTFRVRRMTNGCNNFGTGFGAFVRVCCQDVPANLMVELEVTDASNNKNTCMVSVKVDDKINPIITCAPPKTIQCGQEVVFDNPTASDNCGNPTVTVQSTTGTISNCGTGSRTRTWVATDGGGRTATCSQTVTVINSTPYNGPTVSQWPASPIDIVGCLNIDTDPSKTGTPTLTNNPDCSQVAYTYEDQVFPFVDNVCYKILRKWTVIDWCKFAPNTNPQGQTYPSAPTAGVNTWTFTQTIKVSNADKPVLASCSDRTFCGLNDNCTGTIELTNSATDACTPTSELKWSYAISPFNTGTFSITGNTNNASGTYPVGTHKIRWSVEDKCGNKTTCEHLFTINDCKKPTPYCLSEVTTVIMPSSGQIDIWARDFDLGAFDNCPGELIFTFNCAKPVPSRIGQQHYFKGNGQLATEAEYFAGNAQIWKPADRTSGILFDCADLGVNSINMCVTDAAGNQDFCTVKVNVQANGNACSGSRIVGKVGNESNQNVQQVHVILENLTTNETKAYVTPVDGTFEFAGIPQNTNYRITAEKNVDFMNGVSTLDLVLMQRHALGIENLNTPYKIIAADINSDKKINTADLVELRKLILGVYSELPSNKSWRFVDKSFPMTDPAFPWPFNEYIGINNFTTTVTDNNFVAVKIGDVNTSAATNAQQIAAESRNAKVLKLVGNDLVFKAGELVKIDVTADNFQNVFGTQFTLNFNADAMKFEGIQSGALTMDDSNFNAARAQEGMVSMSWNNAQASTFDRNEVLFSITFRAATNGTTSRNVSLSSDITKSEAYTTDMEVMNVHMEFRNQSSEIAFDLYQNNPNPFTENTVIGFYLPAAAEATLTLYDVTGKTLKVISGQYGAGHHELKIGNQDNLTDGVIFYELESNGFKATKKMIYLSK